MPRRSIIKGTGHYVPDRIVSNAELVAYVGGSAQWIEERTGIRERRWARASQTTSELGLLATKRALEDAGVEARELDALIFATLSADLTFPGCGVLLQDALGVAGLPALDVRNQCSGYLYAMHVADAWIRAGVYNRVLVVGAEIHSAGLDFSEEGRAITVLFGDGAGAVILEGEEVEEGSTRGILELTLGADGSGAEHLCCERPGTRSGTHITVEDIRNKRHYPTMNGRTVFRYAISTLMREISALTERHAELLDARRADLIMVPHQANQRINEHLATQLGLSEDQVIHTIENHGNTTAASIPMALDIARRDGRIKEGALIMHAAFGSGFTWGTGLIGL
ncbi:MAG: beta-ketoacyl-ACP synthase 3 [Myxococcota bacterium]|nr:beta-ketoacyl-ACP synthase 3 [Myxococcota bacterium]